LKSLRFKLASASPQTASNPWAVTHELTAKVEIKIGSDPWGPAPSDGTTLVRFAVAGAGGPVGGQVNPVATDASGEAKYTITSAAAGVSTVSASTTVYLWDGSISVSTDGQGENSGPAMATWWDARISIGPDGAKLVGGTHELTAKVEIKIGNDPWGPAPSDGTTLVRFAVAGAGGPAAGQGNPVATDASGEAKYTITSAAAGVSTVSASTRVYFWDGNISVSTDGGGENSGPATVQWKLWDARISIAPDGVKPVGGEQVFTAKVEVKIGSDPWGPAPSDGTTLVRFAVAGAGGPVGGQVNPVATDASGEAKYTITSAAAGVSTVSASTTVYLWDGSISVSTDGQGENSGPAMATWWDARISIGPDGAKLVGETHELTAKVEIKIGNDPWGPAPSDGTTLVRFAVAGAGGPVAGQGNPVATDASGEAKYTITSAAAGVSTVSASTRVYFWDGNISVSTDGEGENSGPATVQWKLWTARISIGSDGVKPVGGTHELTAKVEIKIGNDPWGPAPSDGTTLVRFKVAGAGGPVGGQGNPVATDASGEAKYTITSAAAGVSTVSASTTVYLWDGSISVSTDGQGENSGPATATWWAARISIGPDGAKLVGETHELTAKVEVKIGNDPWGPAPSDGTTLVRFAVAGAGGPVGGQVNPVATDASGEAKYTITSATAGISTVSASTRVYFWDGNISVSTDGVGENSGPCTVNYTNPKISGWVTRSDTGAGLSGGTVNCSNNGGTATTDANGNYSRYVPSGWSGMCTPSYDTPGEFTPTSRSYSNVTSDQTNQNYKWEPVTQNVSLLVNSDGATNVHIESTTNHDGVTDYIKYILPGSSVELIAPSYHGSGGDRKKFLTWGNCIYSKNRTISFTIDDGKTCTVVYTDDPEMYSLTVSSAGAASVPITGNPSTYGGTTNYTKANISHGTSITLTAPLVSGDEEFSHWTGCDSTDPVNTCTVIMTSNKAVEANYTTPRYTLTVNSSGASSVPITSSQWWWEGTTNYTKTNIPNGTSITLTAPLVHESVYFIHWTGCDSTDTDNRKCTVNMTSNKTVEATYGELPSGTYALTVNSGNGSGAYAAGTVVEIKAYRPWIGSEFDRWIGDTAYVANVFSPTTTVDMPAASVTVTATYRDSQPGTYTLIVYSAGASEVPIEANPLEYGGTTDYATPYIANGTEITLTAPATSGKGSFASWSGCDSTNADNRTCTVTMSANRSVTAHYVEDGPPKIPSIPQGVLMLLLSEDE
jgi:hypothetical protein